MDRRREILAIIAEKKLQAERLVREANVLAQKYGLEQSSQETEKWEQSDEEPPYAWDESQSCWPEEEWNSSDC